MKIKGIHHECGREFLAQQILDTQGHCPWDGKPFTAEYTALLARALQTAEAAGSMLEEALEEIADMGADLSLDEESVLGDLRKALGRTQARKPAKARR